MLGSYLSQLFSSSPYSPVYLHDDTERTQVAYTALRRPLFVFFTAFVATVLLCLGTASVLLASRTSSVWNSSPGDIIPKGFPMPLNLRLPDTNTFGE